MQKQEPEMPSRIKEYLDIIPLQMLETYCDTRRAKNLKKGE